MKGNRWRNKLAWLLGGSVPRDRVELDLLLERTSKYSQLFAAGEMKMLRNVISLPHKRVEDVMVPYGRVDWLKTEDKYAEIIKQIAINRHSRYPVMNSKGDVIGILHVKNLVDLDAQPDDLILKSGVLALAEPRTVPESKKLDSMLRDFQYYRTHMTIVADAAGKPSGMITIEDVLEHIVGAIHDEFDSEEDVHSPIRATSTPDHWQVAGDTPMPEFNEHFDQDIDTNKFETVSGWLSNKLGRLPTIGDTLEANGLTLRVLQTDERRVLSVEVAKQPGNNQLA